MPIGTLIRNNQCQLTDVTSQPPTVGPTAGATMTAIMTSAPPAGHGPAALAPYLGNFGRVSEAYEQAAVIVFLASDAAAYVTGQTLAVDGGLTIA